jgi:hypothetical protein
MDARERRRFVHGLGWGAVASVVAGAITLLLMIVQLWPAERPFSVLAAQEALARLGQTDVSVPFLYLVGAVGQLAVGAFCGGMLTVLSEPVTMPSALGLGALRWFFTQNVVFPALGWFNFGLEQSPTLWLISIWPHLAWALSLGWLMRQEEEGRERLWLHPRQWHLARIPRRYRR